ncbi:hypothetical protein NMG60_11001703 [Bertholletia excelsa]
MESREEGGVKQQQQQQPNRSSSPPALAPLPEEASGGERENNNNNDVRDGGSAVRTVTAIPNFIGKHRLAAVVAHLDHQIQIIQEELQELETLGESSLVCKELVSTVESIPDGLLPVTKGPAGVGWDRWFQGGHGSRGRKRWI